MSTILSHIVWLQCKFRMHIWNVLHTARWIYRTQKIGQKIAICARSHKFVGLYLRNWGMYRQSEKYLLNNNISSTYAHNMVNFGPLAAKIDRRIWGTHQISTGFASWLRYCSDVAQRKSTKLCTMFGRLLGISPHSSIKLCRCSDRLEKF